MGIRDRDYMKRRGGDDDPRSSATDSKLEDFFSTFLQKHPRFLLYTTIVLGALVLIALIVAKLTSKTS